MTSREQFETAWKKNNECEPMDGWESLRGDDGYTDEAIDGQWWAWQASRETLEVEIDNYTEFEIEHMICPDKDGYSVGWIDGRNYAVKQVRTAGIKVKGRDEAI